MSGRFTKIAQDTFEQLQVDAGLLLNYFNPASPNVLDAHIITATTGGITVTCTPTYSDWGEDVDNCPNATKELMHLESWDCGISGTALGTSPAFIKKALGAADIDNNNASKIVPRANLEQTDFADVWWVGDRADGGMVAVRLINALSTGGFSIKTTKNNKGNITFELKGHVSINAQSVVPMEFYSAEGSGLKTIAVTSFASSTDGATDITIDYVPATGQSLVYKLGSAPVTVALDDVLSSGWEDWDGDDPIDAVTGQYITVAAITTSDSKAKAAGYAMVTASLEG